MTPACNINGEKLIADPTHWTILRQGEVFAGITQKCKWTLAAAASKYSA